MASRFLCSVLTLVQSSQFKEKGTNP